jgi:hypothetical protein
LGKIAEFTCGKGILALIECSKDLFGHISLLYFFASGLVDHLEIFNMVCFGRFKSEA